MSARAAPNAPTMCAGWPAIRLRPAASISVTGFRCAIVCSQPARSSTGTKTGAKKSERKTGSCINGAACSVRKRIATPADHSSPMTLTRAASV